MRKVQYSPATAISSSRRCADRSSRATLTESLVIHATAGRKPSLAVRLTETAPESSISSIGSPNPAGGDVSAWEVVVGWEVVASAPASGPCSEVGGGSTRRDHQKTCQAQDPDRRDAYHEVDSAERRLTTYAGSHGVCRRLGRAEVARRSHRLKIPPQR